MRDLYSKLQSRRQSQTLVMLIASAFALGASAQPAVALTPGQVDTFSSGTTEGWVSTVGNPTPPIVVASGGPAGIGDGYVLARAMGSGADHALTVLNAAQWAGDYVRAGVAAFHMDCLNAGRSALVIRVMVSHIPTNGEATHVVLSKPIVLPPDKGWVPVVVSIALNDLTTISGSARMALSGATEVRIVHGTERELPPAAVVGVLGVDNFQAIGTPVSTQSASWSRIKSLYR